MKTIADRSIYSIYLAFLFFFSVALLQAALDTPAEENEGNPHLKDSPSPEEVTSIDTDGGTFVAESDTEETSTPLSQNNLNAPPEGGDINFSNLEDSIVPAWFNGLDEEGGKFLDGSGAWEASASLPENTGMLILNLDRETLKHNIALTLVYEDFEDTHFIVSLYDENEAIVARYARFALVDQ